MSTLRILSYTTASAAIFTAGYLTAVLAAVVVARGSKRFREQTAYREEQSP